MSIYEEATAAGCMAYSDPETLSEGDVDPLLWPAVEAINRSGWVWTGESCQGHPDATYPAPWAGNTDPYLRLFFRTGDEGRLFGTLLDAAAWFEGREFDEFTWGPHFDLCLGNRKDGWTELYVYIKARTTWERDMGIRFWERFAAAACEDP